MAITNLADYKSAVATPHQGVAFSKGTSTARAGIWSSLFTVAFATGAAPGANAQCSYSTAGAINGYIDAATLNILGVESSGGFLSTTQTGGAFMLVDRLTHCSGLNATLNTEQAIGSVSLPRYTSGVGVMAAIEVYTLIGGSTTTGTLKYNNAAGTPVANLVSYQFGIGGNSGQQAQSIIPIGLASGDNGVTKAQSVTLTATTGTAGDFGVTLFKPLLLLNAAPFTDTKTVDMIVGMACQCAAVQTSACLTWLSLGYTTTAPSITGVLKLVEF